MGGSFWLVTRIVRDLARRRSAAFAPPPAWIERAYANGVYPVWEHAAFALISARCRGRSAISRACSPCGAHRRGASSRCATGAAAGVTRSPSSALYARLVRSQLGLELSARADRGARAVRRGARERRGRRTPLRARAMAEMNALAPAAHARAAEPLDLERSAFVWLPVVQPRGRRLDADRRRPKPTIADPFMERDRHERLHQSVHA